MISKDLEQIIFQEREKGSPNFYIVNSLKEYLQLHVLAVIYSTVPFKTTLIFTGGTCLRHFYQLPRLSEDLDFDYLEEINVEELKKKIEDYFITHQQHRDLNASIRQRGQQILLKFPVLKKLGLAGPNESEMLYVKIDLSPNPSPCFNVVTTAHSQYGLNFVARHFDLSDLMAGKIHAVFRRPLRFKGKENRAVVKGRDYFDLLWFVQKGVKPNMKRLSEMLSESITLQDVMVRLDQKVAEVTEKYKQDFQSELLPLIRNPEMIVDYIENYQNEYLRHRNKSFSNSVQLFLVCQKCHKDFASGLTVEREVFEGLNLPENLHVCPFCGFKNRVGKKDYHY